MKATDVLEKAAQHMRDRAATSAMKTLADDIDNAALEIEADILKAGEGAQKYKQLQALLKDLS